MDGDDDDDNDDDDDDDDEEDTSWMREWNEIFKQTKTAFNNILYILALHIFFFFLLISYKISLDWYTLILLLTT